VRFASLAIAVGVLAVEIDLSMGQGRSGDTLEMEGDTVFRKPPGPAGVFPFRLSWQTIPVFPTGFPGPVLCEVICLCPVHILNRQVGPLEMAW
jgi:hypothetical protein